MASAFDSLRTKQQMGYIVSVSSRRLAGSIGLSVTVQSNSLPPPVLEKKMMEWLRDFRTELEALSETDVKANARGLAALFLEQDRSLDEQHDRYNAEILLERFDYGRRERRAAAILALEKRQLLDTWDRICAVGSPENRLLRLHVYSQAHAETSRGETTSALTTLAQVRDFKGPRELLPRNFCAPVDCGPAQHAAQ